jgi:chorismate mutase
MTADQLRALRDEIDAVDARIVAAVNARLEIVDRLWRLKAATGVDRVDPDRERQILERLRDRSAGPLSEDGLRELVAELLALTKREQERRAGQGDPPARG